MFGDHRELSDPRRALQLGVGMSSPLWPTFFLAAGAGMAYWAWAHWGRKAVEAAGSTPLLEGIAPPPATKATPKADRPSALDLGETVAADAAPILDENLAVQAAAAEPAPRPPRKPRPAAAKPATPKTAAPAAAKRAPKTARPDVAPPAPIHRRGARHS